MHNHNNMKCNLFLNTLILIMHISLLAMNKYNIILVQVNYTCYSLILAQPCIGRSTFMTI